MEKADSTKNHLNEVEQDPVQEDGRRQSVAEERRRSVMSEQGRDSRAKERRQSLAEKRRQSVAEERRQSVAEERRQSVAEERRQSVAEERRQSVANLEKADTTDDLLNEVEQDIVQAEERRQSVAEERRRSVMSEQGRDSRGSLAENRRKSTTPSAAIENRETSLQERLPSPEIAKDAEVENPDKDADEGNSSHDALGDADGFPAKDTGRGLTVETVGTGQFVQEALEEKRVRAKDAFKRMIEENARLEHDFNTTQKQLNVILEQRDAMACDLDLLNAEKTQLAEKVESLETDLMKANERAAAAEKAGVKDPQDGAASECGDLPGDGVVPVEERLKELNLRLQRLARDDLEKDGRLRDLESEVNILSKVIEKLEPLVDKDKFQEIMASKDDVREEDEGDDDFGTSNYVVNVRGTHSQSKVCSIQ